MPKLKKKTILPSAIEERDIARQAVADGTVLTAEMIKEMKPITQFPGVKRVRVNLNLLAKEIYNLTLTP